MDPIDVCGESKEKVAPSTKQDSKVSALIWDSTDSPRNGASESTVIFLKIKASEVQCL